MHSLPVGQTQLHAPQLLVLVCRSKQPAGLWQQTVPEAQAPSPLQPHTVSEPSRMQVSPGAHSVALHTQRPALHSKLLTGPTSHCSAAVQRHK
jgi:hypothetical protein